MKPLTKPAEKALSESIASWEDTASVDRPKMRSTGDCSLCNLYLQRRASRSRDMCRSCPIRHYTGHQFCKDSPYMVFHRAASWHSWDKAKLYAYNEVLFLKRVLRAGIKARKEIR